MHSVYLGSTHKSTVATDALIGENRLQSSVPTSWNPNNKSNRTVVVECEGEQPKSKITKLFSFMDSDEEDTENMYTDESQLRAYLLKPTTPGNSKPLAFWKDHADTYPKLAVLTMKHLAVPASSAPVEFFFSIVGKVFCPDRCNLSDKTFLGLIWIDLNYSFILVVFERRELIVYQQY